MLERGTRLHDRHRRNLRNRQLGGQPTPDVREDDAHIASLWTSESDRSKPLQSGPIPIPPLRETVFVDAAIKKETRTEKSPPQDRNAFAA